MSPELAPGDVLGDLRIVGVLGRGGTATVYLALAADGAEVAVKLYRGRNALKEPARFWREIQVVRSLSHEGLVRVLDFGWDPSPHLVMERVHGSTLRAWLSSGPPRGARVRILADVFGAVAHAHERGVIHRDLKPENVFVRDDGRGAVADFGTAQGVDAARLTTTGKVQGTPGYVSPEQLKGERATPASDQYALGVLAFETLTGKVPFAADTPLARMYRQLTEPPPSSGDLSDAANACLQRMMASDPGARFASIAQAAEALWPAL